MNDSFCKIFLFTPLSKQALFERLTALTNGTPDGVKIRTAWGILIIVRNDDHCLSKTAGEDGFLFFPYYLEVEPAPDTADETYVRAIGALLQSLWGAGFEAVAACDFEDALPENGGIDRLRGK